MEMEENMPDESPKFSESASCPTVSNSRPPSLTNRAHSIHNVISGAESMEEELSGDVFPVLGIKNSPGYLRKSSSMSSADRELTENEEFPVRPLGSIDIKKLKNSMKIRSAYLSYNDMDDDDDGTIICDNDDDNDFETRPRNSSVTKSVNIEKKDSLDSFISISTSDKGSEEGQVHTIRERDNTILTYEIFSNGEKKYCHRTMRDLFIYMLKSSQRCDKNRTKPDVESPVKDDVNMGIGYMQLRDLRRLEYLFTPQEEPAVFVRRHAVIISLDPLRVVVMADRLILLVPDGADVLIQLLSNQMLSYMNDTATNMPFEMQAYEAVFGTVIEIQKLHLSELDSRIKKVSKILRKYSIVPVEVQEKVQQFKQRVSEMIERARGHKHVMEEVLEDDELALMALSLLKEKPQLYNVPLQSDILNKREEGESLLESYLMDYNSIQSKLTLLKSQLHGAESLVSLRLDTSRNELLITNTVVSLVSCTFAVGGYVGALFGMNLRNGFEGDTNSGTFWTVAATTTFLVIIATVGTIVYLKYTEILPSRFNILSQREIKNL